MITRPTSTISKALYCPVPNGVRQIHIQTPYDDVSTADHFAIKSLRIVKLNPDSQEVARIDGHSGFSLRFGSPFRRGAADPPINIGGTTTYRAKATRLPTPTRCRDSIKTASRTSCSNTHDDPQVGGLALWQPASSQVFDLYERDGRRPRQAHRRSRSGPGRSDRPGPEGQGRQRHGTGTGRRRVSLRPAAEPVQYFDR